MLQTHIKLNPWSVIWSLRRKSVQKGAPDVSEDLFIFILCKETYEFFKTLAAL